MDGGGHGALPFARGGILSLIRRERVAPAAAGLLLSRGSSMESSVRSARAVLSCAAAVALAVHPALVATAASAIADPCKLVTVVEIQQIVGPLSEAPRATDPKSGEIQSVEAVKAIARRAMPRL
jgi:hypothetical protein